MSQTSHKSENISFEVTQKPGCLVELHIQVAPLAIQAAYQKALKNINKEVSFPGFRKGKAPVDYVLKKFGHLVDKEWKEIAINSAFSEAIQLCRLYPISNESVQKINIIKISQEEGASFDVSYERKIVLPEINSNDLQLKPMTRAPIQEKDVDEALEQTRLMKAEWTEVTDRGIEEGDFVDLDINTVDEPVKSICENQNFEVSPKAMGEWMRKLILGVKTGESVEGISEQEKENDCAACKEGDSSHDHKHASFTPTKCRITIKKISRPILPAMDEQFAESLGCKTLQDLRKVVTEQLEKRAILEQREDLRNQLKGELLNKYSFDIPYSMINREKNEYKQEFAKSLEAQNESTEVAREKSEELVAQMDEQIAQRIRLYLLLNTFARQHNIEVTQQDMQEEMALQIAKLQYRQSYLSTSMTSQEVRNEMFIAITMNKALDLLADEIQSRT